MPELDIAKTTTPETFDDYSVDSVVPDSPSEDSKETYYDITNFPAWFGNYKKIAKIKKAIDGYATWILGKGYEAHTSFIPILENIRGWGEDTFQSILWNAIVMKKVCGDSFTEIIRNERGTLINLKPLNPYKMRIVVDSKGLIKRYEYHHSSKKDGAYKEFKPHEILHLCNNRVTDEIHGVSDVEAVEWIVEAQEEAMKDYRKILHRNGIARVIYVDTDDTTKINTLKTQWKDALDKGDVLILPKGTTEVQDSSSAVQDPLNWVKYLDNLFYMSIGVPRVILGGSEEFTEASSKIGYLTFEQIYLREQTELEADLWNQLAVRVKFNKPASIKNELLQSEQKNTGQTGIQPTETTATLTRNE